MVNRVKTGPGGSVGPQGGADVSIPVGRLTRPRSVPIEGPYGPPVPQPFILYKLASAVEEETLINQGNKGEIWDIPWGYDDYWAMQSGTDPDPTGPSQTPLFETLADIGGAFCDGPPFSALMSGSPGAIGSGQWYSVDSDGTHFDLLFQYEPPGDTYIQMNLHSQGVASPSSTHPTGYWEWSGAASEDITVIVTIDVANNTEPTIFIAGGNDPTPTSYSSWGEADCTLYVPGPGSLEVEYNWGNNEFVKGIGFFRGAGSQAIADYWHAYNWGA